MPLFEITFHEPDPESYPANDNEQCPGCQTVVSSDRHDFSLCTQLQNALYRIRELERQVEELRCRTMIYGDGDL